MCNWIHVSLGVVALGLFFLLHERDAATADSHLQDCEPPIHFTAAFTEPICSRPGQGYTVRRSGCGKDILRCYCSDRRLQCPSASSQPGIEYSYYVDDNDKKVLHVLIKETYVVESIFKAEWGICHVEIPDFFSKESSPKYSEVTTSVTPKECSTVSESDNHSGNGVLVGFLAVFIVLFFATLVALIAQTIQLKQEKSANQGLRKENDRLRTNPVRQAGDGGPRQMTEICVDTTENDQADTIDVDNDGRDDASAGHNTSGEAPVPNVDPNSLPSIVPSNQQTNHLPSPNDVRVHSLPGVQPSNVVTSVNIDDNTAMYSVHSTPSDFHSPPAGVHATPEPSERPFPSSDTLTYQDVDTIPQRETAPLIAGDDEDRVKQRNEHDNKAQERQS